MADKWTVEYDNDGNGSYAEWFDVGPVRVSIGYQLTHEEAARLADRIADMMNVDFPPLTV